MPVLAHYTGKRILVTGGAGYLGSNLVAMLRRVDCHIVRLDRHFSDNSEAGGAAQIVDIVGDVRERAVWERAAAGVDVIFHFAAQTSTYEADGDPPTDFEFNVMPMLHALEAFRRHGWKPVIAFSSTVTIAGIPERLPVDETHPDRPLTAYDLHKQMAEQYLKWYIGRGTVRGTILRLANVFGPGPKSSRSDRGILNQMIRNAAAGKPLTVYRPGDRLRDYVFVEDVVLAFLEAVRRIDAVNGRHFVIGSGRGHTLSEAMRTVAERAEVKLGRQVEIRFVDPPTPQSPIENRQFVADPRRFNEATGWTPRRTFVEGVDRTLEAFS